MSSRPVSAALRRVSAALAATAIAACASHPAATSAAAASPASAPTPAAVPPGVLAAYAGHPFAVFPLQRVSGDSTVVGIAADSLRQRFDDAFAAAAHAQGVATDWAMAAELERSARRNPGYVTDPRALTVAGLASRRSDDGLTAALGTEVRSAVALHDARFAAVPHVLRLAADGDGRSATASLVVIDARLARVIWRADVAGRGPTDAAAAVAAAERFASLFVAQ